MEYILSAFWSLLEMIALYYFLLAFLPRKTSWKICFLTFAVAWLFPIFYTVIGLRSAIAKCLSLIVLLLLSFINFKGFFLKKLLITVLSFTLDGLIDTFFLYGASALLGISPEELIWKKATYTLVVTTGKAMLVLLGWMLLRLRRNRNAETPRKKWLFLSLLFPVVSLIILTVFFYSFRGRDDISIGFLFFCVFLALANVAIIYLIQLMEKSMAESKRLALLNQQTEIQTESILALEQNYRAQRQATHEFHNSLTAIAALLASGEADKAAEYIRQLQGTHPVRIFTVNSRHPIIDAILNCKYHTATEKGIDIRVQVNDLSGISIRTDQLVVLLSNLLDNAIEACMRLDGERIIQCTILAKETLFLSIRNTSPPVHFVGDRIPTSKASKSDHGYGLSHIDTVLNQLHGEFIRAYNDGWFEFAAEIPLPEDL